MCYVELNADDPEDTPTVDELVEVVYPNGSDCGISGDFKDLWDNLSGEWSFAPLMRQRRRNRGRAAFQVQTTAETSVLSSLKKHVEGRRRLRAPAGVLNR